jgi:hypothetical protein
VNPEAGGGTHQSAASPTPTTPQPATTEDQGCLDSSGYDPDAQTPRDDAIIAEHRYLLDLFGEKTALFLAHLLYQGAVLWVGERGYYSEVRRPDGWQQLHRNGNRARLQDYDQYDRPFICLNTGRPFAVIDVDPRNGGDIEKKRALLGQLGVRIYAEVNTPSGGRHFYIAGHPELPSVHSTEKNHRLPGFPGVDIQSFGCNVFTPGTLRIKYGDDLADQHAADLFELCVGYEIVFDQLDQLDSDNGAQALADWVAQQLAVGVRAKARPGCRGGVGREWEWDPCQPWDGTPPDARQVAYLQAALTDEADKVAKTGRGGRNDALFEAALKMGSYIAGAGMDEQQVIAALLGAAQANGYTAEDGLAATNVSIRSGLRCGKKSPRAVPAAKEHGPRPRGNWRLSPAQALRHSRGLVGAVAKSEEGNRHLLLRWAARRAVEDGLLVGVDDLVWTALAEAAEAAGLSADDTRRVLHWTVAGQES